MEKDRTGALRCSAAECNRPRSGQAPRFHSARALERVDSPRLGVSRVHAEYDVVLLLGLQGFRRQRRGLLDRKRRLRRASRTVRRQPLPRNSSDPSGFILHARPRPFLRGRHFQEAHSARNPSRQTPASGRHPARRIRREPADFPVSIPVGRRHRGPTEYDQRLAARDYGKTGLQIDIRPRPRCAVATASDPAAPGTGKTRIIDIALHAAGNRDLGARRRKFESLARGLHHEIADLRRRCYESTTLTSRPACASTGTRAGVTGNSATDP